MPKTLVRIVALLLVPCLLADPVQASLAGGLPAGQFQTQPSAAIFQAQALNPTAGLYTWSPLNRRTSMVVLGLMALAAWSVGLQVSSDPLFSPDVRQAGFSPVILILLAPAILREAFAAFIRENFSRGPTDPAFGKRMKSRIPLGILIAGSAVMAWSFGGMSENPLNTLPFLVPFLLRRPRSEKSISAPMPQQDILQHPQNVVLNPLNIQIGRVRNVLIWDSMMALAASSWGSVLATLGITGLSFIYHQPFPFFHNLLIQPMPWNIILFVAGGIGAFIIAPHLLAAIHEAGHVAFGGKGSRFMAGPGIGLSATVRTTPLRDALSVAAGPLSELLLALMAYSILVSPLDILQTIFGEMPVGGYLYLQAMGLAMISVVSIVEAMKKGLLVNLLIPLLSRHSWAFSPVPPDGEQLKTRWALLTGGEKALFSAIVGLYIAAVGGIGVAITTIPFLMQANMIFVVSLAIMGPLVAFAFFVVWLVGLGDKFRDWKKTRGSIPHSQGGLIGKWMPLTEPTFDRAQGVITFRARHRDTGQEDDIRIHARLVSSDHFMGLVRYGRDELQDEISRGAFFDEEHKREFLVLENNTYGIHGIGSAHFIALGEAYQDNPIAFFHEAAEAMGAVGKLDAEMILDHLGKLSKTKELAWYEDQMRDPSRAGLELHYAIRAFQRALYSLADRELTFQVRGRLTSNQLRALARDRGVKHIGRVVGEYRRIQYQHGDADRNADLEIAEDLISRQLAREAESSSARSDGASVESKTNPTGDPELQSPQIPERKMDVLMDGAPPERQDVEIPLVKGTFALTDEAFKTFGSRVQAILTAAGFEITYSNEMGRGTFTNGDLAGVEIIMKKRRLTSSADRGVVEHFKVEATLVTPDNSELKMLSVFVHRPVSEEQVPGWPSWTPAEFFNALPQEGGPSLEVFEKSSIDRSKIERILYVAAGDDVVMINQHLVALPSIREVTMEDLYNKPEDIARLRDHLKIYGIVFSDENADQLLKAGETSVIVSGIEHPITWIFRSQDALNAAPAEKAGYDLAIVKRPGYAGVLSRNVDFWSHLVSRIRLNGVLHVLDSYTASPPSLVGEVQLERLYPSNVEDSSYRLYQIARNTPVEVSRSLGSNGLNTDKILSGVLVTAVGIALYARLFGLTLMPTDLNATVHAGISPLVFLSAMSWALKDFSLKYVLRRESGPRRRIKAAA